MHQRLRNILWMSVSLGRISRRGRLCLMFGGAYVSDTRMDKPGVSYDDARRASYWVPEVPTPYSRLIWLISWEYNMKSPWNKSNSSVVSSGAGSGGPLIKRSSAEISMFSGSVGKPVRVNYTYLHELNYPHEQHTHSSITVSSPTGRWNIDVSRRHLSTHVVRSYLSNWQSPIIAIWYRPSPCRYGSICACILFSNDVRSNGECYEVAKINLLHTTC
jgi:hypothetical protein